MKAPDKIYVPEGFYGVYKAEDTVEYIRKDALLEWAKENRDSMGRLSYTGFVDKLNSM